MPLSPTRHSILSKHLFKNAQPGLKLCTQEGKKSKTAFENASDDGEGGGVSALTACEIVFTSLSSNSATLSEARDLMSYWSYRFDFAESYEELPSLQL